MSGLFLNSFLLMILSSGVLFTNTFAMNQHTDRWSVRMAESAMISGYQSIYNYVDATAMKAFRQLWHTTGDARYYRYIVDAVDNDLSLYAAIPSGNRSNYIDPVNGGSLILMMYSQTHAKRYKTAADSTLAYLTAFDRSTEGGFFHKSDPRMQIDDLYMAGEFLTEYARVFDHPGALDEALLQTGLMEKYLRDPVTGLWSHAWFEEPAGSFPAGPTPIFWGRGMGWAAMAMADMLDWWSAEHAGRDSVLGIFQRYAEALARVQDDSTGVWWQILDRPGDDGNWLESSASCMCVYALAKGVRLGYLDESYWEGVTHGYRGILDQFIQENADSTITITNVCPGQRPSTDYSGYVTEPYENGHAVGPFIMASIEIEYFGLPPSALQAGDISATQIQLAWQDNTDDEDGFRIERAANGEFVEIDRVESNTTHYLDTGLDPLTRYQYRVRFYKGNKNSVSSDKVTAITLAENGAPGYASRPGPANNAVIDSLNPLLCWTPGTASISHDVYFGTTNPPPFVTNRTENFYAPGPLQDATTYYWRIDEVNSFGVTTGPLWSFETSMWETTMVAHWNFDALAGSTLEDMSGNNNTGTLHNMDDEAWGQGVQGNALYFDGMDDYVTVDHDPSLDFAHHGFTICFWLHQSVEDNHMTYIMKGTHFSPGTGKRFEVYHHMDNQIRFVVDDGLEQSEIRGVSSLPFITGNWVHIAIVRNTRSGQLEFYRNGTLENTTDDRSGSISNDEHLFIGVASDENDTHFKGGIDEIRIFDEGLSKNDIELIYNNGLTEIEHHTPPSCYELEMQTYPNPFNSRTTIQYALAQTGRIKLSIYNLLGQEVEVLVNQIQDTGSHSVTFDASTLQSGIYLCRLRTASEIKTNKLIYVK